VIQAQTTYAIMKCRPENTGVHAATWNAKSVGLYLEQRFDIKRCRTSVWQFIKALGLTWKLATKVLCKASAEERAAFLQLLLLLLILHSLGLVEIYYMDECGLHPDLDLKYGYAPCGERLLACSSSPWRGKVNVQGLAGLNGELEIRRLPFNGTDAETANFYDEALPKIKARADADPARAARPRILFEDNARFHGKLAKAAVEKHGFTLIRLPRYSPDFNIVEELWHWIRSDVKANTCFGDAESLWAAVGKFADALMANHAAVVNRLTPKTHTDAKYEKKLIGKPKKELMDAYKKHLETFSEMLKSANPGKYAEYCKLMKRKL
jgi:hypothetical protein